jgi:LmbE family N-acetylglucosaminyl deacetylase
VLCLGAHADDIEIGCGGTMLSLLAARRNVQCHWIVFSGGGTPREQEARRAATLFLKGARSREIVIHAFRDGFFPYAGDKIKEAFEVVARTVSPDLIFTHTRHDRHQDHRVVSDLTWNTFRDHWILEYEIPKYDGDLGQPNCFVPISPAIARAKIRNLLAAFPTQRRKRWFSAETFQAMLQLRGIEAGLGAGSGAAGGAEAFYARKSVIGF